VIDAKPIRVLICDDHPMFRQGVRGLLDAATDLDVVAEAATGDAALELAASAAPDVVLMDIQIPVINGIEFTRRIVAADPDAAVLVLTMFDDDSSVFAAMRAGARGYVLKGAGPEELLIAVRAAARGEAIFSPQIARRLMDYFSALHPASAPASVFPDLTEREREILTHVARGRRNSEISRDLFISPKTVTNHITNILAKLQVADRTEAILRARDAGLA
jgi:DNA-binding NarL/FixJ family response regulator